MTNLFLRDALVGICRRPSFIKCRVVSPTANPHNSEGDAPRSRCPSPCRRTCKERKQPSQLRVVSVSSSKGPGPVEVRIPPANLAHELKEQLPRAASSPRMPLWRHCGKHMLTVLKLSLVMQARGGNRITLGPGDTFY